MPHQDALQPNDAVFHGSIPELYDRHLVPLIFAPYAEVMVERLRALAPRNVLEIAAGTGVLTRAMATRLPGSVAITATDLNQSMLDEAMRRGTARPVEWRQADAGALPFDDASFDAVVCQFGAMFFPDKVHCFREARRVLRPGGTFFVALWDRLEENEFIHLVMSAFATRFGAGKVDFMRRTPHGYFEWAQVQGDLRAAGFTAVRIDEVARRSVAPAAESVAVAFCCANPMQKEIEQLGEGKLEEATRLATEVLRDRYGSGPIEGKIQALIVEAMT